jgi:DNA-binding transcriptional regulator YdaS (Cro superfamily)
MKLSAFKADRSLTLSELAKMLDNVPVSTLHGWLSGRRACSLADAVRIERATGGAVRAEDMLPEQADAA